MSLSAGGGRASRESGPRWMTGPLNFHSFLFLDPGGPAMIRDDLPSLFDFNRWADARVIESRRVGTAHRPRTD